MPMHHRHVPVPVCTISILLVFHTNPYQFSETTSGNNRVTAPVKPQETTNYELQGTGRATRAPVAQTLQSVRQPNMLMHHRHVAVHVCTISILWNFHTNPYQSSETTT